MSALLQQLNTEMAHVVEEAKRALVEVRSGVGAGAGTIWHSDGLVITNAHVARHYPLTVTLADGRTLPARLLAHDPTQYLAALALSATGLPTVALGESLQLRPGQWVIALGHPWGIRGGVTAGVVIGMGTGLPEAPDLPREWIATNLPLRPGNSGGPSVDARGRLVGINTMITGPEVGLAVPVHAAKAFLRESLGSQKAVA